MVARARAQAAKRSRMQTCESPAPIKEYRASLRKLKALAHSRRANVLTLYGIACGDIGHFLPSAKSFYIVKREKHETCSRVSHVREGRHMTVRARFRGTSPGSARVPSGTGSVQDEHSLSKSNALTNRSLSAESGSMGNMMRLVNVWMIFSVLPACRALEDVVGTDLYGQRRQRAQAAKR